jgi:hypothetical protein
MVAVFLMDYSYFYHGERENGQTKKVNQNNGNTGSKKATTELWKIVKVDGMTSTAIESKEKAPGLPGLRVGKLRSFRGVAGFL